MESILQTLRFLLLILLLPASPLFSQVMEQWVARYNAEFAAMAVDAAGNVYVTGSSRSYSPIRRESLSNYVTVKYDTEGKELWTKPYGDPLTSYSYPEAIAVDPSGNVYVTGASSNEGSDFGYTTIKYDGAGNELWLRRYNGPGPSSDAPNAMLVDAFGNVYITGASTVSGMPTGSATVKYDTDGNELWANRYNGPPNEYPSYLAVAIAADASGNVYVTGQNTNRKNDTYDYATIKYDAQGNESWVKRFDRGHDFPTSIAVDASGNIYVTGYSSSSSSQYEWDYSTIKYDAQGNELWVRTYKGEVNTSDEASALAVDPAGNVYVTGTSNAAGGKAHYATVKYDSEGNELWVSRYSGSGNGQYNARAITLDPLGNVYVTGSVYDGEPIRDIVTIKYDNNGNEQWTIVSYSGPDNFDDQPSGIALDAAGNVYVAGWGWNNFERRQAYAVFKYVQSAPLVVDAGGDKTLYRGYDPACVPLLATVSGGTAPYSYSWSAENGNTSSISVCPDAATTYLVTVIDAAGKQATDEVKVNVIDVRCGHQNNKVLVCHKGKKTLCINASDVADHLGHGDQLGTCAKKQALAERPIIVKGGKEGAKALTRAGKLQVYVAPNPVQHSARIYYNLEVDGAVEISVFDAAGRQVMAVEKAQRKAGAYSVALNTASLVKGLYYYQFALTVNGERIVQGGKLMVVK